MANTNALARIRNTQDLKNYLEVTPRFTLCANCPHAAWEATETEKNDKSSGTEHGLEIFSPMVTGETDKGFIHMACYCTERGRYVPMPISYCQTYEQTLAQMEA